MLFQSVVVLLSALNPATAQTAFPYASVDTVGGHTAWDQNTMIAVIVESGVPTGGQVTVTRDLRTGTPLIMTGSLSLGVMESLYYSGQDARVSDHAETWTAFQNVDLPTIDVRVLNDTQTVHQSESSFPLGAVETSGAMSAFIADTDQQAAIVADAPLFEYHAAGGHFGYDRLITVTQSGWMVDDSTDITGTAERHATGWLTPQTITDLQTLAIDAHWFSLVGWSGHPSWVDGIDEEATACHYGDCHPVWGGYTSERTVEYQAFLDALVAAGDAL